MEPGYPGCVPGQQPSPPDTWGFSTGLWTHVLSSGVAVGRWGLGDASVPPSNQEPQEGNDFPTERWWPQPTGRSLSYYLPQVTLW